MDEIINDIIHPELARRISAIRALADTTVLSVAEHNQLPDEFAARRDDVLGDLIESFASGAVRRVPYLSDIGCAALVRAQSQWTYQPNQAEGAAYQMDECVLSIDQPEYYAVLQQLHDFALAPLWVLLYGVSPEHIRSIQLARYRPGPRAMTNWHYDADSSCTTVVELTSGAQQTGAALQVFPGAEVPVSPIAGYATLFQGRQLLHRSMPVVQGERVILVHWVNHAV